MLHHIHYEHTQWLSNRHPQQKEKLLLSSIVFFCLFLSSTLYHSSSSESTIYHGYPTRKASCVAAGTACFSSTAKHARRSSLVALNSKLPCIHVIGFGLALLPLYANVDMMRECLCCVRFLYRPSPTIRRRRRLSQIQKKICLPCSRQPDVLCLSRLERAKGCEGL